MLPSSLSSLVFASVVVASALALAFLVLGIGTLSSSSAYSLRRVLILFTAALWQAAYVPFLLVPTTPSPLDTLLDDLPRHMHETVCRAYVVWISPTNVSLMRACTTFRPRQTDTDDIEMCCALYLTSMCVFVSMDAGPFLQRVASSGPSFSSS